MSATGWLLRSDEPLLALVVTSSGTSTETRPLPPGPVIFERVVSADRQLYDWFASTLADPAGAESNATLEAQSLNGTVVFGLTLQDALPVEWGVHLYPDGTYTERIVLDATSASVAVP